MRECLRHGNGSNQRDREYADSRGAVDVDAVGIHRQRLDVRFAGQSARVLRSQQHDGYPEVSTLCAVGEPRKISFPFRVTTGPNGQMAIGHTQMRCNAKNKPMCNPWKPPRRPCDHNQPANLCFRLLVNCDGTRVAELEEELESLRGQKWILFGYGVLSGFVIGCIVTAVGMMCIDGCCDDSNKQSGSGGGEPRFRRVIETE